MDSARQEATRRLRLLGRGETQLEQGHYSAAILAARSVVGKDPNHLGGLELLARAHWRAGDFEKSLDVLRHLIRLNPYEPGYHYMRATALQSLGHYGEAIDAFSRCLVGENESLKASAAACIRDLESWQEEVIAELLKSDRKFRAEYAANAMGACKSRGFAFAESPLAVKHASAGKAAVVWDRPS